MYAVIERRSNTVQCQLQLQKLTGRAKCVALKLSNAMYCYHLTTILTEINANCGSKLDNTMVKDESAKSWMNLLHMLVQYVTNPCILARKPWKICD